MEYYIHSCNIIQKYVKVMINSKLRTILALTLSLVMVTSLSSAVYAGAPTATLIGLGHSGSDGPSTFFTIDSSTGAATAVGPTGFERCSAMDIDDAGTIFASCERTDGSDAPVLITINPSDGSGTEVGLTGADFDHLAGSSFRPSDGTLFGFDATSGDHRLRTIDTGSGLGSDVGSTGLGSDGGNGITFVGDILYHIARDNGLHTLDQSLGTASAGTSMTYDPGFGNVKAMDTDVENGIIWAIISSGSGGAPTSLGIVDVDSETVTEVGPNDTEVPLDAIAVVGLFVGGSLLSIDNTTLLLAGLQSSAIWMLPVLAGVAGSAFGVLYIKSRRN